MPRRRLKHDDYTIAWVCPLEVELVAALQMLDEVHEGIPQPYVDNNIYNLGSINGYNVVIASLHIPGTNSAATAITQLKNTFQKLRFSLLVGVGGGVPIRIGSERVHLGDVVVGKPEGQYPGVVQYDHGKAEVGEFKRTGALAPPPTLLLGAVNNLAAHRRMSMTDPVYENMQRINTGIPGLRMYRYPGAHRDRLYRADYAHPERDKDCDECCDQTHLIHRDSSQRIPSYVVVHSGTIASGEIVLRNGALRDLLRSKYEVVCFEMEAAGVASDFPCLVIRGICDYADSHKNDDWHGYAAAAAAAYARQLFFHLPVHQVDSVGQEDIRHLDPAITEDREKLYRQFRRSLPTMQSHIEVSDSENRKATLLGELLTWKFHSQGPWWAWLDQCAVDGYNLNVRDQEGKTPLHHAVTAKTDSIAKVQKLLEKGADPRMMDFSGLTPVDLAREANPQAFIFLLRAWLAMQEE